MVCASWGHPRASARLCGPASIASPFARFRPGTREALRHRAVPGRGTRCRPGCTRGLVHPRPRPFCCFDLSCRSGAGAGRSGRGGGGGGGAGAEAEGRGGHCEGQGERGGRPIRPARSPARALLPRRCRAGVRWGSLPLPVAPPHVALTHASLRHHTRVVLIQVSPAPAIVHGPSHSTAVRALALVVQRPAPRPFESSRLLMP